MEIRLAEEKDLPALAGIRGADPVSERHWLEQISAYYHGTHHPQKALAPRVIFVAVEDEHIIGFVAGHRTKRYDCDGELQWIDVIPGYRGNGVATILIRCLFDWFRAEQAKRICVKCAPDNTVAMRFYQKNGAVALNDHWLVWEDIDLCL